MRKPGIWVLETETDEDGRYERTSVTPGAYLKVIVEAPAAPYWEDELRDVQPGERVELAIRLPSSVRLVLVLRDAETGAPIPRALVWLKDAETRSPLADDGIYTDGDGRLSLGVPPGRAVGLSIDPEGYLDERRTVAAEDVAAGPVEIALTPALSITGRVLRFDGTPARRVQVHTFDPREPSGLPLGMWGGGQGGETDADGRFELAGMSAGEHGIGVAGDNWRPIATVLAKAGDGDIEIRLAEDAKPIRKVTVRVTGPGGAPIHELRIASGVHLEGDLGSHGVGNPGAPKKTIYFVPPDWNYRGFFQAWDARARSGERLPFGHLWLAIPDDVPDPWLLELPPEQSIEGRVLGADGKPVGGATVVVRVLDPEGKPIGGATVTARKSERTEAEDGSLLDREWPETSADGRVVLPALAPGVPHDIWVEAEGSSNETEYFPYWQERWIPDDIEIRLDRQTHVEGVVRTPGGKLVLDFVIEATDPAGEPLEVRRHEAPGRFRVGPLREGTQVQVTAHAGAATSNELVVAAGTRDAILTLDLGAWFRVELDEGSLRRLRTSMDFFAEDITFHVFPGGVEARLSASGAGTIAGLDGNATYTLLIGPNDAGRYAERSHVLPDGRTVTVALIDGKPIRGTLRLAEGVTLESGQAEVRARREGIVVTRCFVQRNGTFEFPGLPPGRWILRVVERETGRVLGEAEAEAGDEQVTITLNPR